MRYSHTSMYSWRRCKVQFHWKYKEGFLTSTSPGQRIGSIGYSALAEFYRTGSEESSLKAASNKLAEYEQQDEMSYVEDWDLISTVLSRYYIFAREYDNFNFLSVEQEFRLKMGDEELIGFIDAVVERKGGVYLMEHKFAKQASLKHVSLDPQISVYMLAAKMLGVKPRGIIYNVVRTGYGGINDKQPVLRADVFRNVEGLQVLEYEIGLQMKEMTEYLEKGGDIYRTPTKDCSWDCGFYAACLSINDSGKSESVLSRYKKYEPKLDEGAKEDGSEED